MPDIYDIFRANTAVIHQRGYVAYLVPAKVKADIKRSKKRVMAQFGEGFQGRDVVYLVSS